MLFVLKKHDMYIRYVPFAFNFQSTLYRWAMNVNFTAANILLIWHDLDPGLYDLDCKESIWSNNERSGTGIRDSCC